MEFVSSVTNGKLHPAVGLAVKNFIESKESKRLRINMVEAKDKRSLKQNRFYFHKIVPAVQNFMRDYTGENFSLEETHHEILVKRVWKHTKLVEMPDGEMAEVRKSSADTDTELWEKYQEITRAYFAKAGLQLPYPNEIWPV